MRRAPQAWESREERAGVQTSWTDGVGCGGVEPPTRGRPHMGSAQRSDVRQVPGWGSWWSGFYTGPIVTDAL